MDKAHPTTYSIHGQSYGIPRKQGRVKCHRTLEETVQAPFYYDTEREHRFHVSLTKFFSGSCRQNNYFHLSTAKEP